MANKGFLLVTMQPPPAFEEEFNAWYDTEHIPERLAVPGFERAVRFVSTGAAPRYLAMYDMARPEVIDSADYLRVAGDNSSPWSKRVLARVRVYRSTGAQVYPGGALTGRPARASLLRFRALPGTAEAGLVAGLRRLFEGRPEVAQLRVFAYPTAGAVDFLALVEQRAPLVGGLDLAALGEAGRALDLVNEYTAW